MGAADLVRVGACVRGSAVGAYRVGAQKTRSARVRAGSEGVGGQHARRGAFACSTAWAWGRRTGAGGASQRARPKRSLRNVCVELRETAGVDRGAPAEAARDAIVTGGYLLAVRVRRTRLVVVGCGDHAGVRIGVCVVRPVAAARTGPAAAAAAGAAAGRPTARAPAPLLLRPTPPSVSPVEEVAPPQATGSQKSGTTSTISLAAHLMARPTSELRAVRIHAESVGSASPKRAPRCATHDLGICPIRRLTITVWRHSIENAGDERARACPSMTSESRALGWTWCPRAVACDARTGLCCPPTRKT